MPVISVQFRRTAELFNSKTFLTFNLSQPFFSDTTMHQCYIAAFCMLYSFSTAPSGIIFTIHLPSITIQNSNSKISIYN